MTSIRDIDYKYIGGGFGFSATKLSNGKVIANWVDESSEAYAQGMRPERNLSNGMASRLKKFWMA